ncbi:MAG: hypothetical protein ABI769_02820 [Pseudomonadota bacterium]
MNILARASAVFLLVAAPFCCNADDSSECHAAQVVEHVMEQFAIYGPRSTDREFFGFIYRNHGVIASAVVRGPVCEWTQFCEVNTGKAAPLIPQGAKVLGEWHTHPHVTGSRRLSPGDVLGANKNSHIRCYRAYFSTASGEIFSWSPGVVSVWLATDSMVRMGNYRKAYDSAIRQARAAQVELPVAAYP